MTFENLDNLLNALGAKWPITTPFLVGEAKSRLASIKAVNMAAYDAFEVSPSYEGRVGVPALIVKYANRGEWRKVLYATIELVDFERVTDTYAIFHSEATGPIRSHKSAPQVFIVPNFIYERFQKWREELRKL